jgi:hypothetical protein
VTVKRRAGLVSAIFGSAPRAMLSEEQAERLGTPLSKALAEATVEEAAVFYLNEPESGEQARITSGGLYVRNNELTVRLANYQYIIPWGEQATGGPRVTLRVARDNPFSAYPESDYQLVAGPGQKFPGGDRSWMGRFFGTPSRSVIVALSLTPEPPVSPPASEAAAAPAAPPPAISAPSASSQFEEKLRTLKKLRDDGLISESDYEMKKQELLKGF